MYNNTLSWPSLTSDIENIVAGSTWVINNREKISAKEKKRNNNDKVSKAIKGLESENEKEQQSAKQQQQQKESTNKGENNSNKEQKGKPSSSNSRCVSSADGENCGGGDVRRKIKIVIIVMLGLLEKGQACKLLMKYKTTY